MRTTWHPPALPPATSSHPKVIRPVSGSMALFRTKSFTVSLMAFSGATPCCPAHAHQPTANITQMAMGTNNQLWAKAAVEAYEAFIVEHLAHAVETVLVQQLSDNRASLILHPGLAPSSRCQRSLYSQSGNISCLP